jgi:hypothetical protein
MVNHRSTGFINFAAMEELTNYILQFGNLNQQQIDLIRSKADEITLLKGDYLVEAGKPSTSLFLSWKVFYASITTTTKVRR